MTMSLDTDLAAIMDSAFADTLIPGYTATVTATITLNTIGSHDAATGTPTGGSSTPHSKSIMVLEVTEREIASSNQRIQMGDLRVLVRVDSDITALGIADTVAWGGNTYLIVTAHPIVISGSSALIEAVVRKR